MDDFALACSLSDKESDISKSQPIQAMFSHIPVSSLTSFEIGHLSSEC